VPVVDIVEIGNGGGSIAWLDDGSSLRVGPRSAGAIPGPVAYGKGGQEPTTTDANLILGRLSPENFDMKVDMGAVKEAIRKRVSDPLGISVEDAALGIVRIANSNMLNALKLVSVRRGHDPRDFSLVAFGGGGSLHAPSLAEELSMGKVIVPAAASVFSAWGMLMTDMRHDFIRTIGVGLDGDTLGMLEAMWREMENDASARYAEDGIGKERIVFSRFVDMRYLGQEHTVKTPFSPSASCAGLADEFGRLHEKNYTFKLSDAPVEIVNLHLVAMGTIEKPEIKKIAPRKTTLSDALKDVRAVIFEDLGKIDAKIYDPALMPVDVPVQGPAIIEERTSVTIVYEGQQAHLDPYGNIIVSTSIDRR
jgi:N-methylhydantoinase A